MSKVAVRSLRRSFEGKRSVVAVDDLDLTVEDGQMLVLLGPSGCGKTTTLRCIAGLDTPDAGTISIGDAVVFDRSRRLAAPPNRRDIGMVFQSYALWPHKTVRDNIGYPLRARRIQGKGENLVENAAALVRCEELLDRYPSQLSGGQQQRVSLARGFVARPGVVLFDEPLSNLDARLRDQVRTDLHELHRRVGFTGIYVTHDQIEAMAIADRLAVMRAGKVVEQGTPAQIFNHPATDYTAEFVGYLNGLELTRDGTSNWTSPAGEIAGFAPAINAGLTAIHLRVRPEDVQVVEPDQPAATCFRIRRATIADAVFAGRTFDVVVQAGTLRLRASIPAMTDPRLIVPGVEVDVLLDHSSCRLFSVETGAAVVSEWREMAAS